MSRFLPKFKIDTDKLQVGSVIPTSELVDIVRTTPNARRWDSKLQQVCKYIEAQRADLWAAVRGECVVILPPDERAEAAVQGIGRAVKATLSATARALDPQRTAIADMSPNVKRGFESMQNTAAALAQEVRSKAAANERLAGLLSSGDAES